MSRSKYSQIVKVLREAGRPMDLNELAKQTGFLPGTIVNKISWAGEGIVHKVLKNNRVFYKVDPKARNTKGSRGS